MNDLINRVHQIDAFELMQKLPDQSVDLVLTDPPYGTTDIHWDIAPDTEKLLREFSRVTKPNAAIVITSKDPFSLELMNSAKRIKKAFYRYKWIWVKTMAVGFLDANKKPLKRYEDVLVFGNGLPRYYPQMATGKEAYQKLHRGDRASHYRQQRMSTVTSLSNEGLRYPTDVLEFSNKNNRSIHPTEKPLPLWGYLIATYTQPGDLVLDPYAGSGVTGAACFRLDRSYIIGDTDPGYVSAAAARIAALDPFADKVIGANSKQLSLFA